MGDLDSMVEESLGSLLKRKSHVWDDEDLVTEKQMVVTLLETNISPFKGTFELMIVLFLRLCEYRTKLGMNKVVFFEGRGVAIDAKPIGAHPKTIPKTIPSGRFAQGATTAKPIGAHPT